MKNISLVAILVIISVVVVNSELIVKGGCKSYCIGYCTRDGFSTAQCDSRGKCTCGQKEEISVLKARGACTSYCPGYCSREGFSAAKCDSKGKCTCGTQKAECNDDSCRAECKAKDIPAGQCSKTGECRCHWGLILPD